LNVCELDNEVISIGGKTCSYNGQVDSVGERLGGDKLVGVDVKVVTVEVGADTVDAVHRDGHLRLIGVRVKELKRDWLEEEVLAVFTVSHGTEDYIVAFNRVGSRGFDLALWNIAMVVLEDNLELETVIPVRVLAGVTDEGLELQVRDLELNFEVNSIVPVSVLEVPGCEGATIVVGALNVE
jgi:hypothetical protein